MIHMQEVETVVKPKTEESFDLERVWELTVLFMRDL